MAEFVVAADMFSDRVNGKLIRGFKGDTIDLPDDHPAADRFTKGDRPVLMSKSDWKKLQEGEPVIGGPEDAQPSGATAGIVTEGVQSDVPSPEQAARDRALAEQEESRKSSDEGASDSESSSEGTETAGGDETNANATSPAKAGTKKKS